jgi:hypothetical protein
MPKIGGIKIKMNSIIIGAKKIISDAIYKRKIIKSGLTIANIASNATIAIAIREIFIRLLIPNSLDFFISGFSEVIFTPPLMHLIFVFSKLIDFQYKYIQNDIFILGSS